MRLIYHGDLSVIARTQVIKLGSFAFEDKNNHSMTIKKKGKKRLTQLEKKSIVNTPILFHDKKA